MNENSLNSKEILETQISEIQGSAAVSAPVAPAPATPKSHSATGWKITTFIFALLAVAGLGFGVFELLTANQAPSTPEPVVSTTDTTDDDVRAVISELKATAESALPLSSSFYKVYDDRGIEMKVEGVKSVVNTDKSYGIVPRFPDSVQSDDFIAAITNKLKELGFTAQTELDFVTAYSGPNQHFINDSGITCTVYGDAANCAHTSWVSLTEEDFSLINELADAFNDDAALTRISGATTEAIKDSRISPYQIITTGCYNGYCAFYRVSPEAKWQYFTGGQAVPSCSEFNTDDLKKAFADYTCYDEATGANSTVQP